MKVIAIILICAVLITVGVVAVKLQSSEGDKNQEYLRIHIRANSNDSIDQSVKYKVKESIVEYMTPWLDGVKSKESAMEILQEHIGSMKAVADSTLSKNGYTYSARQPAPRGISCKDLRRAYSRQRSIRRPYHRTWQRRGR